MYVSGDMVVRWMCVGRWAGGQGVVTCECGRRAGGGWLSKFMVRGGRGEERERVVDGLEAKVLHWTTTGQLELLPEFMVRGERKRRERKLNG